MIWFIACWLIGAAASWIGLAIYIKNRTACTWKWFFKAAKAAIGSPVIEVLKWLLFVIAWPVETASVVYLTRSYWQKD